MEMILVFLLCIPVTKLTARLRRKLRFNIDEIFAWLEAVIPAAIMSAIFLFLAIAKRNAYLWAIPAYTCAWGGFIVFIIRWLCIFIRNKKETHLQIRYAVLWAVGAVMAYFIKSKGVLYYIWCILFLPTGVMTVYNNFMPTAGFIALAVFMTLASLFCALAYKR